MRAALLGSIAAGGAGSGDMGETIQTEGDVGVEDIQTEGDVGVQPILTEGDQA